jgi:hypothetical protein
MQREISKAEKELKTQQDDLRLIRAQLATVRHNAITSLSSTEEIGKAGFERLRNALKKNETAEQERKMRVRREITTLYEQHDNNNRLGEEVLSRARGMQRDIFNC